MEDAHKSVKMREELQNASVIQGVILLQTKSPVWVRNGGLFIRKKGTNPCSGLLSFEWKGIWYTNIRMHFERAVLSVVFMSADSLEGPF